MRAVIQRVTKSSVTVDGKIVGNIGKGLNILLGIEKNDTEDDLKYIVEKALALRIFEDENGKMNLSVGDIQGEILVISQFTLYGDCRKGRRPSFDKAAAPDTANKLYKDFITYCKGNGFKTEHGIFGADMKVEISNDGPVTIILDSSKIL